MEFMQRYGFEVNGANEGGEGEDDQDKTF